MCWQTRMWSPLRISAYPNGPSSSTTSPIASRFSLSHCCPMHRSIHSNNDVDSAESQSWRNHFWRMAIRSSDHWNLSVWPNHQRVVSFRPASWSPVSWIQLSFQSDRWPSDWMRISIRRWSAWRWPVAGGSLTQLPAYTAVGYDCVCDVISNCWLCSWTRRCSGSWRWTLRHCGHSTLAGMTNWFCANRNESFGRVLFLFVSKKHRRIYLRSFAAKMALAISSVVNSLDDWRIATIKSLIALGSVSRSTLRIWDSVTSAAAVRKSDRIICTWIGLWIILAIVDCGLDACNWNRSKPLIRTLWLNTSHCMRECVNACIRTRNNSQEKSRTYSKLSGAFGSRLDAVAIAVGLSWFGRFDCWCCGICDGGCCGCCTLWLDVVCTDGWIFGDCGNRPAGDVAAVGK